MLQGQSWLEGDIQACNVLSVHITLYFLHSHTFSWDKANWWAWCYEQNQKECYWSPRKWGFNQNLRIKFQTLIHRITGLFIAEILFVEIMSLNFSGKLLELASPFPDVSRQLSTGVISNLITSLCDPNFRKNVRGQQWPKCQRRPTFPHRPAPPRNSAPNIQPFLF